MSKADFQIVGPTDEIEERPLFITIYGHPGIGKTSVSFTAPSPILFDFDGGMERAFQGLRPPTIKVRKFDGFYDYVMGRQFEQYVLNEGIGTVIIDTVGTLLDDYIAPWLISNNPKAGTRSGGLTLSGWGQLSVTFNNLRNRLRELGLHVVAIAHAKEEGDGPSQQTVLAVKGGTSDIIYRVSDMIGYMHPSGSERIIDFKPMETHVGKDITGRGAYVVPDVNSTDYNTFLSGIIQDAYAAMNIHAKRQRTAKEQVQEFRDSIYNAGSLDEVSKLVEGLKGKNYPEIVLVQMRSIFKEYLQEHGLKYQDGEFVEVEATGAPSEKPKKTTNKTTKK
ncbi:MAG: ATP-binding protein [Chloroflexi bacterium]|nr:MAG: ATP-binding protein [Chloroflexota bacterium]